jgi:hypothetical protein
LHEASSRLPLPADTTGMIREAVLAGALAWGTVGAQVHVPDNSPGSGTVNSIPLGGKGPTGAFQNMRTQIRVPASFLPAAGSTITEVGFAGASDGVYSYSLLEVRFGHLPGATFGVSFAGNLGGASVVLSRPNAQVTMATDRWSMVGLSGSFAHDGRRDLVVDVVVQGAAFSGTLPGSRRSSTLETVYALNYFASQPVADGSGPYLSGAKLVLVLSGGSTIVVGQGCPKADQQPVVIGWSGTPARAQTFHVRATAAPSRAALLLLVGQSEQRWGQIQLPFDLLPLGAGGCVLRTDVLAQLSLGADAGGSASLSVPIADDPTLRGQVVLFQWAAAAPGSNPLGVVLSAMLKATIQ